MAKSVKTTTSKGEQSIKVASILITLPRPESEKSPYFDLAKKYNVQIDFHPFIQLEGLSAKDFRKQKLELVDFTGVILLSRNAVDHFFRMCDEMKFKVSPDLRYFCITEAVALYLQKFIIYRKRKVFFSADGSNDGLMDVITKYKDKAKFLLPVSENTKNEISQSLIDKGFDFSEAVLYRTIGTDISNIMKKKYDVILFFSPFSIDTLLTNNPKFGKKDAVLGAFGNNTCSAIEASKLICTIKAPAPGMPSMVSALSAYLDKSNN